MAAWWYNFRTYTGVAVCRWTKWTVEAFSYPVIPLFGMVLYTDNLTRDLLSPVLAASAHQLGYLAGKLLQMLAPRLIQIAARANAAYLETEFSFCEPVKRATAERRSHAVSRSAGSLALGCNLILGLAPQGFMLSPAPRAFV